MSEAAGGARRDFHAVVSVGGCVAPFKSGGW